MKAEQARIMELAEFLDINIQARIVGNTIELDFESWHDNAKLRLEAFDDDFNPEAHVHVEEFVPGQEAYQQWWISAAQQSLDELGIAYRIEQNGHEVEFKFDRVEDHAAFVELRDRGDFHMQARIQPSIDHQLN